MSDVVDPSMADAPFHCPPDAAPTDMELFHAYEQLGSVWKVGQLYGMRGSTVHHRIKRTGLYRPRLPEFADNQIDRIREYYETTPASEFDLQVLANELGKSRANVCRAARRLGLSNQKRPLNAAQIDRTRLPRWKDKPHPRGMCGKKHSTEALDAISASSKKNWSTWKAFGIGPMAPAAREARAERSTMNMAKRSAATIHSRAKGGYREDLAGMYFRSSWEANYARYLNLLMKLKVVQSWEFEPETFWFENIKRGVRSYLVDFKVFYVGDVHPTYVEVKGYMDAKSKTKIARFRKYYPQHRLEIVGAKEYRAIARKWSSAIPNWESAKDAAECRLLRPIA